MQEEVLNQAIYVKEYIYQKEYEEVNKLQEIISSKDKVNLKLELDYKLNVNKDSEIGMKRINEFFYYIDNALIGYLGISCFGGNVAEINGMTHPDWRRKGIFKKLLELAMNECGKRNFNKILLLSDGNSSSGINFIKAIGEKLSQSVY